LGGPERGNRSGGKREKHEIRILNFGHSDVPIDLLRAVRFWRGLVICASNFDVLGLVIAPFRGVPEAFRYGGEVLTGWGPAERDI
jgi:hypothetical protein